MSVSQAEKARKFRALHEAPGAFVIANPWDAGSARMLAGQFFNKFEALVSKPDEPAAAVATNTATAAAAPATASAATSAMLRPRKRTPTPQDQTGKVRSPRNAVCWPYSLGRRKCATHFRFALSDRRTPPPADDGLAAVRHHVLKRCAV